MMRRKKKMMRVVGMFMCAVGTGRGEEEGEGVGEECDSGKRGRLGEALHIWV